MAGTQSVCQNSFRSQCLLPECSECQLLLKSMTEISEKEQPLWQVWSAEECDAGLTVENRWGKFDFTEKAKLTADSEEGRDFRAMYAGTEIIRTKLCAGRRKTIGKTTITG